MESSASQVAWRKSLHVRDAFRCLSLDSLRLQILRRQCGPSFGGTLCRLDNGQFRKIRKTALGFPISYLTVVIMKLSCGGVAQESIGGTLCRLANDCKIWGKREKCSKLIALGCRISDLSYLTIIMKLRCGGVAPDDISLSRNHKMTHTVHTGHSSHNAQFA